MSNVRPRLSVDLSAHRTELHSGRPKLIKFDLLEVFLELSYKIVTGFKQHLNEILNFELNCLNLVDRKIFSQQGK